MRRWLPELLALPLLPWLVAQGKRTRRITPRLPEAAGARSGLASDADSDGQPLELLAIGESPVAGVGVELQEQAITARLAAALAGQWQRPVVWRAYGRNGATVREATQEVALQLPMQRVDVLLVAFGVNDTTAFRSSGRYRRELQALLEILEQRLQPALVVLAGVPPVHLFPALPQPLRLVLGMKASALDRVAQQLARQRRHTLYVPVGLGNGDPTLMAHDGYHPSAAGVQLWATTLAQAISQASPQLGRPG